MYYLPSSIYLHNILGWSSVAENLIALCRILMW